MKIIQVSTFYKPAVGGVEKQVEEITQNLIGHGHTVTVFTTDADHGAFQRIGKIRMQLKNVVRFRYLLSLGDFFRFSPYLPIKLFFTSFDVIHVHNAHDAHLLPAIIIKLIRRKKLILTGHNPFIIKEEKRTTNISKGIRFYEFVLKVFARFIDKYIALVESEKKYVMQHFGIKENKIVVIPNGLSDFFYEKVVEGKFVNDWNIDISNYDLICGSVCRMNYAKGLQNLKYAADNLQKVLFIFGGGDDGYLNTLKELYKDNLNVLFTNRYLSKEETRDFYSAIDLFLLPSEYEPFGITLIEAMAQGKAILASDVGGPVEIVKKSFGKLINPRDQKEWYKQILHYLNNKNLFEAAKISAHVEAEKYKWEHVIEMIEENYK